MSLPTLQMGNDNHTSAASHSLPEIVFLDRDSLCSDLVDDLGEAQCNWIGMLHLYWEVDLSGFSLSRAVQHQSNFEIAYLTLRELIPLTLQLGYEPVTIKQQTCWVYTVCSRVAGLDRVRLVFSFYNPHLTKECVVLATNRLDWSPRKVVTQGLQHFFPEYLKTEPNYKRTLSFSSASSAYNVA